LLGVVGARGGAGLHKVYVQCGRSVVLALGWYQYRAGLWSNS